MDNLQHPASSTTPPQEPSYSVYLPLLLAGLSLVLMLGFQTSQLLSNQDKLNLLRVKLNAAAEQAQEIRTQFDGLSQKTVELAASGNSNAQYVLQELKKQGIDLTSHAPEQAQGEGGADKEPGG